MSAQDPNSQSSPNIDITNPYTPRRPAPIVSISINHPIATLLRKIKNFLIHKQTLFSTSFNIKVTPIVALVSFFGVAALFGGGITTAFNFGKTVGQRLLAPMSISIPTPSPKSILSPAPSPAPSPVTISRTGTIKATYQLPPESQNPVLATPAARVIPPASVSGEFIPTATAIPTPTPAPKLLHYILTSQNGSILFLTGAADVRLKDYLNTRVLVTGILNNAKNTLNIAKPEDIEVLQ